MGAHPSIGRRRVNALLQEFTVPGLPSPFDAAEFCVTATVAYGSAQRGNTLDAGRDQLCNDLS
jgi:hypothetical protein